MRSIFGLESVERSRTVRQQLRSASGYAAIQPVTRPYQGSSTSTSQHYRQDDDRSKGLSPSSSSADISSVFVLCFRASFVVYLSHGPPSFRCCRSIIRFCSRFFTWYLPSGTGHFNVRASSLISQSSSTAVHFTYVFDFTIQSCMGVLLLTGDAFSRFLSLLILPPRPFFLAEEEGTSRGCPFTSKRRRAGNADSVHYRTMMERQVAGSTPSPAGLVSKRPGVHSRLIIVKMWCMTSLCIV